MKVDLNDKDINFLKIINTAMKVATFKEIESSAADSFVFAKFWLAEFLLNLEKPVKPPVIQSPPTKDVTPKKKKKSKKKKGKRK